MSFHHELNEIRKRAGIPKKSSIEDITPNVIRSIKRIVKKVHDEEGCDVTDPEQVAHCWIVAEILTNKYGWQAHSGVYLSRSMEPIGDHVWNQLDDGTVIDSTPLQFHEGYDIRIVPPGDPEHKRYRYEWTQDYNPGRSNEYPELKGVDWSGEYDIDTIRRLKKERGSKWWVKSSDPHQDSQ